MIQLKNKQFRQTGGYSPGNRIPPVSSAPGASILKDDTMNKAQKTVKGLIDKFIDEMNKLYKEWNKEGGYQWEVSNNPDDHGIMYCCHKDGSISFDGELLSHAWGMPEFNVHKELWESIDEVLSRYEYEEQGFGNYQSYLNEGGE